MREERTVRTASPGNILPLDNWKTHFCHSQPRAFFQPSLIKAAAAAAAERSDVSGPERWLTSVPKLG